MQQDFLSEMFPTNLNEPEDPNVEVPPTEEGDPTPPVEEVEETEDKPGEEVPLQNEQLKAYIDFLVENELLEVPEDFNQESISEEDLPNIFEHTKKARQEKATKELVDSFPEDFLPVLDYVYNGGSSVKDFLEKYGSSPKDTLDITNPEGQRQAVFMSLKKTSNYSDEKINRIVGRIAEDPDELAIEALEAYNDLVTIFENERQADIDAAKQLAETRQAEIAARTEALATAVTTSSNIHPQRRQKVKSFFFDPINTPSGQSTGFNYAIQSILSNPEHQAQLGDLLLDYNPKDGFTSDKLEQRVKTKAVTKFKEQLAAAIEPKLAQGGSSQPTGQTKQADWRFLL